jgi:hypothetical protein
MRPLGRFAALLLATVFVTACGGTPIGPDPNPGPSPSPSPSPGPGPGPDPGPPPVLPPPAGSPVFVGAGDIGECAPSGAAATAAQLDAIGGTVFTTGDNAYPAGTAANFQNCYHPTWGRHKSRTRPSPGNHEYDVPGALPYFDYFGSIAGPHGLGYYSFTVGDWLAISLNSNVGTSAGSAQASWLRQTLATSQARCTVAYWHHPRFSSEHGSSSQVQDLFRILYDADVDLLLTGHSHNYERFAALDPDGAPDDRRGIRQFIVGTGGAPLRRPATVAPYSEARITEFGVLKLTLGPTSYAWEFLGASGANDSGFGGCH